MHTMKKGLVVSFLIISQFTWAQKSEITALTNSYYSMKDAMVLEDGKTAALQAALFLKTVNAVSDLTASQGKTWSVQKGKLKATSEAISKTTDVGKQREQLNELSEALFTVLKSFQVNTDPVYFQYCPMKKAYWLSSIKEIRNPYYGKKMLTCGSVKEILK